MNGGVTVAVVTLAAVVGVLALVLVVRDRPVDVPTLVALGALEVALLVQLVVGVVLLVGSDRDVAGGVFVAYLVGVLLVPPVGALWSVVERSRFGSAVVVVAALTVLAMLARLYDVWTPDRAG